MRRNEIELQLPPAGQVVVQLDGPAERKGEAAVNCVLVATHAETGKQHHLTKFRSYFDGARCSGLGFTGKLYCIDALEPGQWRFVFRATWMKPQVRIATVKPGRFCELRFTLDRKLR